MTVTDATVDLTDNLAIRTAIGGKHHNTCPQDQKFKIYFILKNYIGVEGKCHTKRPNRFFTFVENATASYAWFGKSLIVQKSNLAFPEIIFPRERRITGLDYNPNNLGTPINPGVMTTNMIQ